MAAALGPANGASADSIFAGGHTKARLNLAEVPNDSLLREFLDNPAFDQGADLRLKFKHQGEHWGAEADYQLIGQFGDSLEFARKLVAVLPGPGAVQDDDQRLMDLTRTISDGDKYVVLHRLDRLAVSWRQEQWVARVGRQAVSWGNGLVYNPMDIFNPFDPAAVDKEYKSGDDMAYGQYLRENGDDLQAVWVVRRDEAGDLHNSVNSLSAKYHGFLGENEYDVLLAEHYDELIVGVGGIVPLGGAVLRGDITVTDTDADTVVSAVGSASYSWVGFGKNMSGLLEYYYNGFGQDDNEYAADQLPDNPDLLVRLARGELFTLGKHYLAGSLWVEMSPLFSVSPNLFLNLQDGSFLAQVVGQYDVSQNWQLLLALNLPVGDSGTEFGGIDSGVEGLQLSQGASLFTQLAWYF
ncbi:MAG: hypothetical protein O7F73_16690 [Gammaproteobacteria bacterium]|nr:hypothetical protein [Gammaproteobacteria bacterium]